MKVHIRIEADHFLDPADVWPDGVPDEITADAVVAALELCRGSKKSVLDDWCLLSDPDLEVSVYVDGETAVWE